MTAKVMGAGRKARPFPLVLLHQRAGHTCKGDYPTPITPGGKMRLDGWILEGKGDRGGIA